MTQEQQNWNRISEEERDSYREEAQAEAKENNRALKKLGYGKDSADWMHAADIQRRAEEIAWEDSAEGKAQNAARIEAKATEEEQQRRADLTRIREAWDRGMFAYYHNLKWHEEPLSNYEGYEHLKLYTITKKQVEEARRLGL